MIRVLIVDDQALVRTGLRLILKTGDVEVAGEASDGAQAIELVAELRPDVVLMDIRMPELDGLEATRRIMALDHVPRVIILTTFDLDRYVYEALQAGASGFLLKDASPEQLLASIRLVMTGDALLAPAITRRLVERFAWPTVAPAPGRLRELTPREVEVLRLMGRGLSNAEIAAEFRLSEATVKTHVTRIFTKLHLRDRAQAVVLAYESELVRPGGQP